MASPSTKSGRMAAIGDIRWLRGHVSTFFVGVVLLVVINLATRSNQLWSVTAAGIWLILLAVHGIVVLIARLTRELLVDAEEEELVLLPVKDAVFVSAPPDIGATWVDATPPMPPDDPSETVSWQIATDAAQHRRGKKKDRP